MNGRRQIVITRLQEKLVMLYMENEKIYDVLVGDKDGETSATGDIFVGRVQHIVQNINAAFVEYAKGENGYLSLSERGGKNLKCGDELVVQIKRAAVKTKQPVLTMYPETAGRYCVVTTKTGAKSISRKIDEPEKREELKEILREFDDEEYGITLRTNARNASPDDVRGECRKMLYDMRELMGQSVYKSCFSRLRRENPFYLSYIRGCRTEELDRIVTDVRPVFDELREDYGELVEWYEDESYSLDNMLGISSKLAKAFERHVWLKSGGSLVIEPTEALTVIDVNTGKAVDGKRSQETTFFRMNCEAAIESARQIRMRNISGIILIDFIDMKKAENRAELLRLLREELKKDKTKAVLVDITKLGLVEITRAKKNPPIREMLDIKAFKK